MRVWAVPVVAICLVASTGCGITQLGPSQRHHFEHSALNFEVTATYPRSREPISLARLFESGEETRSRVATAAPVSSRTWSGTNRTPRREPVRLNVESVPQSPVSTAQSPVVLAARSSEPLETLDDILGSSAPSVAEIAPTVVNSGSSGDADESQEETPQADPRTKLPRVVEPVPVATVKSSSSVSPSEKGKALVEAAPAVMAVPAPTEVPQAPVVADVPEEKSPVVVEKSTDKKRMEIAEAARRLVGVQKDFTSESLLQHVLRVNGVELDGTSASGFNRDFFRSLRNQGLSYDTERPSVGDIVFFHNTHDVNSDGRNNDWYSATGVITEVTPRGTVTFVSVVNDEVRKLVMNLGRPEVRRDEVEQSVLNSYLRSRKISDPEYTQYLAGELFAGYASVALP